MIGGERTMPTIIATWNGKVWRIRLPGEVWKSADTRRGVERIVARDAYGSAIKFVGKDE